MNFSISLPIGCQNVLLHRGVANGGRGQGADCPPSKPKIGKGKKGERKEKRGKGREKRKGKEEERKRKGKGKGKGEEKEKKERKGKEKRRKGKNLLEILKVYLCVSCHPLSLKHLGQGLS